MLRFPFLFPLLLCACAHWFISVACLLDRNRLFDVLNHIMNVTWFHLACESIVLSLTRELGLAAFASWHGYSLTTVHRSVTRFRAGSMSSMIQYDRVHDSPSRSCRANRGEERIG